MSDRAPKRIAIVGRGRVGRSLALRLRERGHRVTLLAGRSAGSGRARRAALARADVIWLTVPDPAIDATARAIAAALEPRAQLRVAVHASGSLSEEVLAPLRGAGACIAVAHPILSFGTTRTVIEGATFTLAGDTRATREVARLVRALGARAIVRAVHGPRYHAALALAANGSTALLSLAAGLLGSSDPSLGATESRRALASLLRSVADNVARVGPIEALTGPVARGDAGAVARHLAALEEGEREDYVAVARLVLRAARARGLSEEASEAIGAALSSSGISGARGRGSPRPRRARSRR